MIRGKELTIGFPGLTLFRDISFAANSGECWALVGPNGVGKSTLLATLVGLVQAQAGTVEIEGKELGAWNRADLAVSLSYLPQRYFAVFPYTVHEFVQFGRIPWLRSRRSNKERDRAAVNDALERLSLVSLQARRLTTLSGGEIQRACLAQVLAQETGTLLLDEPLSHLDLLFQVRTMRTLRGVADSGRCVLLATHDLQLAWRHCHGLAIMGSEGVRWIRHGDSEAARVALEAAYGVGFSVDQHVLIKD